MVDIVKCNAIEPAQVPLAARLAQRFRDGSAHGAMLAFEQFLVGTPGGFGGFAFFRPGKKIAALQNERAAFAAFHSAPHCIFPINSVQRHLPNIMTAKSRTPRGLLNRHTFDRLPQVRAVPGFFLVAFVQQSEHKPFGLHAILPGIRSSAMRFMVTETQRSEIAERSRRRMRTVHLLTTPCVLLGHDKRRLILLYYSLFVLN